MIFSESISFEIPYESQTIWIQIRPDVRRLVGLGLGPNCFQRLSADDTRRHRVKRALVTISWFENCLIIIRCFIISQPIISLIIVLRFLFSYMTNSAIFNLCFQGDTHALFYQLNSQVHNLQKLTIISLESVKYSATIAKVTCLSESAFFIFTFWSST